MNDFIKQYPQDFKGGIKKDAWNYIDKCHSRIDKLERENKALNEKYVNAKFKEETQKSNKEKSNVQKANECN